MNCLDDHDGDHHPDDHHSSSQDQAVSSLTGFLFGNIDKKGELEEDFLDEESKRHLGSLNSLGGLQSMVREITEEAQPGSESQSEDTDYDAKSPTAVDFSDITECVEESAEDIRIREAMGGFSMHKAEDEDDYDDESSDRKLMPPPAWLPLHNQCPTDGLTPSHTLDSSGQKTPISSNDDGSPSKNAPLANMLPPEMMSVDVTKLFPEFRPNQVLRFSRLFKPHHVHHLYKRKKKKKEDEAKTKTDGAPDDVKIKEEKKEEAVIKVEAEVPTDQVVQETTTSDVQIKEEPLDEEGGKESHHSPDSGIEETCDDDWDLKLNLGRPALPEECESDDEELMLKATEAISSRNKQDGGKDGEQSYNLAPWRYGPAQYWYDKMDVDETGEGFDYGFKLKEEKKEVDEEEIKQEIKEDPDKPQMEFPDEAFLMITQVQWEDDIIWNSEEAKQRVLQSHKAKAAAAGWIPSTNSRTAVQFSQLNRYPNGGLIQKAGPLGSMHKSFLPGQKEIDTKAETWYSIFPIENEDLVYGNWEDNIIWDPENMDRIQSPPVLTLDPNDENIILSIPEDRDPNQPDEPAKKEKELKKSKILLGKAGIIKEEDEDKDEDELSVQTKDPFNLSNDEYYNPKIMDNALRSNIGGVLIQHSTPAVELRQPYFPTHMSAVKLRQFHRLHLKKYSHGAMAEGGIRPVLPLLKQIKRKAKMREQERLAYGGGEMFFMRTPQDLTAMDGEIILCEFSEEYPPLMMQVGMATKIKNYYKRKPGKDSNPPQFPYGELAYAHTSPFLGAIQPGVCIQALENNMFRAPIYEHNFPSTDFLVIRNRQNFYIREVDGLYCVGQECPLYEVPGPNSKRANNFVRDFLQVFIYRLFWKSRDNPKRIKMEDIKRAYPSHSESSIRKRLKLCADFKRTGMDSNWWVIKPDFRLPTEEEIRAMVSPEQCCSYYSLIAAEQRLKDAGYGEKSMFAPEEDNEEETQMKIDDEIRTAPWNTTRAYISAVKGKCLLKLSGVADPTGCGEGFSYVKVPNKPQPKEAEARDTPVKRTVTGTDADLRRLNLKDAKNMLRKFGLAESDIKKLSRWEVIDVVRTMSTQQAKAGAEAGMSKFARGNRFSVAEHMERYKEECQRIFDLQNRVLASTEVLSTDDESTSGEDSDFEEMGKNIESMLSNKKTSTQLSREREEAERRELRQMVMGGFDRDKDKNKNDNRKNDDEDSMQGLGGGGLKLKITRTFKDETGKEYTRTEIVRKPLVIETYARIRQTKDPMFIKQFAALDDQLKDEMRKERRRIQEQLRRIKRNQEKPQMPQPPPKKKKKKENLSLKMKCGACGAMGHMRTNKECPMYNKTGGSTAPVQVAMTEEQEEEEEKNLPIADQELINVEGTKIKLSKNLLVHAESLKRKSLLLKFPKQNVESKKKRRIGTVIHCDYLKKPKQSSNRRRTDPLVTLSTIFESVLNELRAIPNTQPFLFPVNPKEVPDYYRVVRKPMDLQSIRENVRNKKYRSREDFLADINQIVENSKMYNGPRHTLTVTSQMMVDHVLKRYAEKEQKLMRLEAAINPLLDANDQKALSYIFTHIVDQIKTVENSWPFQHPVNKKQIKDYYEIVKNPMDFATLAKNCERHKYHNRDEFIEDVELIYTNSLTYNGANSTFTAAGRKIVEIAKNNIQESDDHINSLETAIRGRHEAQLEYADTDSVITGSLNPDDSMLDNESMDGEMRDIGDDDFGGPSTSRQASVHEDSDSEFVDIENEDNNIDNNYSQGDSSMAENDDELAKDLQMTDNEEEPSDLGGEWEEKQDPLGKLSDSEEESGGDGEGQQYYEETEENQDYVVEDQQYYSVDNEFSQQQVSEVQDFDENSFDPTEFFMNSALAQQAAQGQEQTDIGGDLQVSESDSDGDDFEPIPTQNQATEGFDLDEYM
ncbi:transcription initiation factor TFIID subunit 1 isoform X2 [Patella vulgata]|uniref:transcription initiation factor TFIID subunit 1 isoform X2 n=1 Tax=Patella vulgata TaxID=6465 RepID=UPI0024A847B9|nr:transcription initiation factor TFIID subunit 1 isoform X2 [Patella vulgata]